MCKKKALLISGGGSWGAYGGGTLARINEDYNTVIGVSTGALLAPFVALNEWDLLKIGYTSVTVDDIFDKSWYKPKPFTNKGRLRKTPIILSIVLGHETIATSKKLRKTINTFFPEYLFDRLREKDKEVFVGTQNIAEIPSKIHYFSSLTEGYEEFKDWMWCSANFPYFTSLVEKGWCDFNSNFHIGIWTDGGLTDLIGIDQLTSKGFESVDILLLRSKNSHKYEGNSIDNLMDNVISSVNAMRYDIEFDYFYRNIKKLNREGTNVRVFWLPRKLSPHSMIFDQDLMLSWWNEGYETAFDDDRLEIFNSKKSI
ncbi:MAG: patatin-like phospholipase family protein [bacterium]